MQTPVSGGRPLCPQIGSAGRGYDKCGRHSLQHDIEALKDFMELKNGDVIKLDNTVSDNLLVKINGERKFYATPGMRKNKISVEITDVYTPEE